MQTKITRRVPPEGLMMVSGTLYRVMECELMCPHANPLCGYIYKVCLEQATKDESLMHMIDNFDWWYEMTDDHSAWLRGCAAEASLRIKMVTASPAVKAHYKKVCPYVNNQ